MLTRPLPRTPLLSICIPTYNRARWLRHSLAALAPQIARAGDAVELIVSDNCSDDNTPALVEAMQAQCPIRYHRNAANIGANPNFQRLVQDLARGEFVWLLGDDDLVRPDGVERILHVLREHSEIDYVYLNYTGWIVGDAPEEPVSTAEFPLTPTGSPDLTDRYLPELAEIVPNDYTCFTPIYCSLFRLEEARLAFRVDPESVPFSTLESVSPHAIYVAQHRLHRPAWYIGYPCVIVSSSSSWDAYLPVYLLQMLPQLYDHFEQNGIPAAVMDRHRRHLLRRSGFLLWRVWTQKETALRRQFSLWQFIRRNRRYPEFWQLLFNASTLGKIGAAARRQLVRKNPHADRH